MVFNSPEDGAGSSGIASDSSSASMGAISPAIVTAAGLPLPSFGRLGTGAPVPSVEQNMAFARVHRRSQGEGWLNLFIFVIFFFLFLSLRFFLFSFSFTLSNRNSSFCSSDCTECQTDRHEYITFYCLYSFYCLPQLLHNIHSAMLYS